jgi:hypothetical protein
MATTKTGGSKSSARGKKASRKPGKPTAAKRKVTKKPLKPRRSAAKVAALKRKLGAARYAQIEAHADALYGQGLHPTKVAANLKSRYNDVAPGDVATIAMAA